MVVCSLLLVCCLFVAVCGYIWFVDCRSLFVGVVHCLLVGTCPLLLLVVVFLFVVRCVVLFVVA